MTYRTDLNNNPTAFTVDIAKEARLVPEVDYTIGDPFHVGDHTYYTAKLLKDPIQTTIDVINRIGFYTPSGQLRWNYIGLPKSIWDVLAQPQKIYIIAFMYRREMGYDMIFRFPSSIIEKLKFDQVPR